MVEYKGLKVNLPKSSTKTQDFMSKVIFGIVIVVIVYILYEIYKGYEGLKDVPKELLTASKEALTASKEAAVGILKYISPDYIDPRTGYSRDYLTGEYNIYVSPEELVQAAGDIAWSRALPPSLCPSNPSILFGDIRCIDKESIPIYKETSYPTSPEQTTVGEFYFDVLTGTFKRR